MKGVITTATKAHLEGNKRYLATQENRIVRVTKGKRESVKRVAESKGVSVQAYVKALIKQDSGIDL